MPNEINADIIPPTQPIEACLVGGNSEPVETRLLMVFKHANDLHLQSVALCLNDDLGIAEVLLPCDFDVWRKIDPQSIVCWHGSHKYLPV